MQPAVSVRPRYRCRLGPLQVLGGCEERMSVSAHRRSNSLAPIPGSISSNPHGCLVAAFNYMWAELVLIRMTPLSSRHTRQRRFEYRDVIGAGAIAEVFDLFIFVAFPERF